jgi:galactokinase
LKITEKIALTTYARSSENSKFAGGQCGWLDQLLITCSEKNMLTKIDYADNGIQHFASKLPENMQFIAFNTNVPHVLAESDYGHRVKELSVGITFLSGLLRSNVGGPSLRLGTWNALIAAADPSIGAITLPAALQGMAIAQGEEACELSSEKIAEIMAAAASDAYISPQELPLHKGKTKMQSFASILRRMRHQKMSSLLVPLAGEAASQGDAKLFGLLLDLEGDSLRMSGDFMITGDNGAQDALLDAAFKTGRDKKIEVHGRMLGGGGGGNVLLFADSGNADLYQQWQDATSSAYNQWAEATYPGKGIAATIIRPSMAAGARLL